jgi:DNA-binding MarR family transcriptional regulator
MTAIEQQPVGADRVNLGAVPASITSISALRIVGILRSTPSVRTSELAKQVGVSTAAVTGLVDTLERKKLVRRGNLEGDRRVKMIRLTGFGNEIAEAIFAN